MTIDAATRKIASCARLPAFAQVTLGVLPLRRESRKLRKGVRMRMLAAVFLADIPPRNCRAGWAEPPIARTSETVEMIERGVAQTAKQVATRMSRYLMYFWNCSAPEIRPIPSQR